MKFRTFVIALLVVSFAASFLLAEEIQTATAVKTTKVAGANNFGSETLDSVEGMGLVKLNGTSVLNTVQVLGSLIANNAQIGSLEVSGEANLTGTAVRNGGHVTGSLQMVRSSCEQTLVILTQKAVFTDSRLEGITVQKDTACKGKQTLELRKGTVINGPIVFEGGKGEVVVFPGCQILGTVTGGKIVKKS